MGAAGVASPDEGDRTCAFAPAALADPTICAGTISASGVATAACAACISGGDNGLAAPLPRSGGAVTGAVTGTAAGADACAGSNLAGADTDTDTGTGTGIETGTA